MEIVNSSLNKPKRKKRRRKEKKRKKKEKERKRKKKKEKERKGKKKGPLGRAEGVGPCHNSVGRTAAGGCGERGGSGEGGYGFTTATGVVSEASTS